jgi:flagellar basal body P-ring formation protein FlgA
LFIKSGTWQAALAVFCVLALSSAVRADELSVPVARVTIYPGDVISESLLEDKLMLGTQESISGFLPRDGLVGKVSRQTLLPGHPIPSNAVREPYVVVQGQAALVVFQSGALVISASAVPLQAGAVGDTISLRNADSGTTIRGTVQADGTVRVGFP